MQSSVGEAAAPQTVNPGRLIRWPAVKNRCGFESRVTAWRWEAEGRFPKRVKVGPNTVAWIEREIDEWLAERASQRAA